MISTYFMAVGDRPVRSAARRDAVPSGKRRDAAGRSPTATFGRDKFSTGCVANRSCPVENFSPVKQVNIKDRWYNVLWRHTKAAQRLTRAEYDRAVELIEDVP